MTRIATLAVIARARPRQSIVTDVRSHWAQQWILNVVRAGVMDTQPNYTFQPNARVRRGDLAQRGTREPVSREQRFGDAEDAFAGGEAGLGDSHVGRPCQTIV